MTRFNIYIPHVPIYAQLCPYITCYFYVHPPFKAAPTSRCQRFATSWPFPCALEVHPRTRDVDFFGGENGRSSCLKIGSFKWGIHGEFMGNSWDFTGFHGI